MFVIGDDSSLLHKRMIVALDWPDGANSSLKLRNDEDTQQLLAP